MRLLAADTIASENTEDERGPHYDLLAATQVLAGFDRARNRSLFAVGVVRLKHRIDLRGLCTFGSLAGYLLRRRRWSD